MSDLLTSGMISYPCCGKPLGVAGCSYSNSHVTETMKESVLADFYEAPQPMTAYDPRSSSFYAMDCEFVYTTWGKEPARITVVDQYGADVIDCVFHPDHDLVDPNTQYSGLSEEEIEESRMTLREARDLLFEVVNSNTILIGHGLENDLKALRIVHDAVVDTSVLFRLVFSFFYWRINDKNPIASSNGFEVEEVSDDEAL
ncbi:exonuclease [Dictyocaulus viviparus]|uniref:Exonuclease n=1 Tax=Dictyocaulus viviparus TaxID=29172 RepID=A0A0D8X7Y6_DICVI|nr:exonuclease [Dictyocaulus viviparus]